MLIFMGVWFTLVYAPIAHMVWSGNGGLLWDWGVLDFAGGTVVHINAGIAGLVACLVLGKRKGFPTTPMAPHNLGYTLMGAAMLIFMGVWFTLVYAPIAHMVWSGNGGLMWDWGVLDFAGGTVVHINAGIAGLVACLVLGKRKGFPTTPMAPHNLGCLLYTSPSPRDATLSRMPSSA